MPPLPGGQRQGKANNDSATKTYDFKGADDRVPEKPKNNIRYSEKHDEGQGTERYPIHHSAQLFCQPK
jgi:hypothetical protein